MKLNCRKFVLFFFRWGCHYQTKHHVSQAHSLGEREMAWDKTIFTQGEQIRTAHELHHWQSNMFSCLPLCDFPAITREFEAMTTGDIQRMYCISWSATGHSSVSFIAFNHSTLPITNETTTQQGLSDSESPNSTSPKLMLLLKAHLSNKSYAAMPLHKWSWGAEAAIIWAYLRSVHDPANNCR